MVVGKEDEKRKEMKKGGIVVAVYSSQNATHNSAQPHHQVTHMVNHSYSQSRKTQDL